MPPLPLRSSSSKTASLTATLPPVEDILPFMLRRVSLAAGTSDTSTSSHARVSRSLGPSKLKSPDTVGRDGSPDMVDRACSVMSPGKVAVSLGTATAPPRASSSTATSRMGFLL